ncbi:MAG: LamG-like jellyroll fold domain-containing protein [Planctomycetota bacterium]
MPFDRKKSLLSALCVGAVATTGVPDADAALVAYFEFEGTTSSTVGGITPTTLGAPTFTTGEIGQAISFDGVDDFLRIAAGNAISDLGTSGTTDGLTVSAWISPTGGSSNIQGIIGAQVPGNNQLLQFQLVTNGGTGVTDIRSIVWVDETPLTAGFNVASGGPDISLAGTDFIHVAYTWEGGDTDELIRYINGVAIDVVPVDTDAGGSVLAWQSGSAGDISIGASQPAGVAFFGGEIDDLAIFDQALSPGEIAALANKTLTPLTIPEPGSMMLLAAGAGLIVLRRRRASQDPSA